MLPLFFFLWLKCSPVNRSTSCSSLQIDWFALGRGVSVCRSFPSHLDVAFHRCSHPLPTAQKWCASTLLLKVPRCESIPRQGALLGAIWCHCLCLWWDPKWALLALGEGRVGGGVELPTGAIPLGHTWCFHKCTEDISLKMQTRYHRNSHAHFAWPLLLSWITQLIQNWRAWISLGGMFHPATEQKTLALTWHCNVGHACCSTAAEQMWALPNGSVDGPERNNKVCFIATSLPLPFFIFPPLQIQWSIKQIPWRSKNVLVLFSLGAYSLQNKLESLDTCSIHKIQTLALRNKHCFDFYTYFCMFLMYTQLLMNWREEMICSVLGWPYMRLNFKTLNTLGTLVSVHMWMYVCVGPTGILLSFLKCFECGWLHQCRTRMLALQSSWRPGEMKPQAMVPVTGRNWGESHISQVTLLTWKVYGRGAFAMYIFQWLNSTCEQDIEKSWRKAYRWKPNSSLVLLGN